MSVVDVDEILFFLNKVLTVTSIAKQSIKDKRLCPQIQFFSHYLYLEIICSMDIQCCKTLKLDSIDVSQS